MISKNDYKTYRLDYGEKNFNLTLNRIYLQNKTSLLELEFKNTGIKPNRVTPTATNENTPTKTKTPGIVLQDWIIIKLNKA